MNLVKTPPPSFDPPSVSAEAEDLRNELAIEARAITAITTTDDNEKARNVSVEIRTHLKQVESARAMLTKPLLDGQKMLKKLADDHIAPLSIELDRLERLATVYLVEQQKRVAAEEKARLDLAGEAKTDAEFQAVMAEPIAEENRARGQQLKRVMRWECVDVAALAAARPDLVKIEPKAAAILATCVPEISVPGLKLWYENVVTFTTR